MKDKLLQTTVEDIGSRNSIAKFYPFTSSDENYKKKFSYDEVIGEFFSYISSTHLTAYDYEKLKNNCINKFQDALNSSDATSLLETIYLKEEKININSLLLYQTYKGSEKSKDISKIFNELADRSFLNINMDSNVNFLEKIIIDELKNHVKENNIPESTSSYLEFLQPLFNKDLQFISSNKHYFVKNIEAFFELYLFIYCAQLALNLKPNENALSNTEAKELYFVLKYETVSKERKHVFEQGYEYLYEKSKYIFPYFSLLSALAQSLATEDLRLYELYEKFEDTQENVEAFDYFHKIYREAKELNNDEKVFKSKDLTESLNALLDSSYEQFRPSYPNRFRALTKYLNVFKRHIAQPFTKSAGRNGTVLSFDQDTIILLTNISIGESKQLRFQELLKEFKKRGVFFDSKSQNELLNLYERVGNIERKSDSGDAVYVKTTI
ncbi:DNA phosphorothioation-dependent restriction protein DptG [Sulfurimonas sp. C5]|uniref:DNA phosphorothioation-dependent restriction protein DptG n=1 Tax=Sulfurimonas sp. C5 TaxID=3036947 RepID=UPI002457EB8A|nr:DNA phosphorothioation-dependent restriction protein DptG [Sulfurimonas sp. C5]MDH4943956.1 DNA phosphorothioation-dependent restriction protein DptG [Sulfurimonas sp. C5]